MRACRSTWSSSSSGTLPAPRKHVEHVGNLLALTHIAQMTAVIVDGDSRPHGSFQPGELRFVENQVVAVGLRVVVRIAAQRLGDDIEPVVGDQRIRGRMGTVLEIVGCEYLRKIF